MQNGLNQAVSGVGVQFAAEGQRMVQAQELRAITVVVAGTTGTFKQALRLAGLRIAVTRFRYVTPGDLNIALSADA